jgi:Trk K+ transport system NAD-binding subunit
VLIVTSDDLINIATALSVRKLNPKVRIVLRIFNQNLAVRFQALLGNLVPVSVSALTAPLLALTAITGESLATFDVVNTKQEIARLKIFRDSPLIDKPLQTIAREHRVEVIGLVRKGGGAALLSEVNPSDTPRVGDRLIVLGEPSAIDPLREVQAANPASLRGWIVGRIGRVIKRTFQAVDAPVRWATLTLIIVVFLSTLIFHFAFRSGWAESLFTTVALMTTSDSMQGEALTSEGKVFMSFLKIVGTALIAVFTALLTNYFLKARLAGVFEAHRLPAGGHIIVCGLGNIGYRCVEALQSLGQSVVVIENNASGPFVPMTRRAGVYVLIGDATQVEVLKQAHINTCNGVIAATSSELVNFEIALQAKELLPSTGRVVLRLHDPTFAQVVRDAANIRYALSPHALAAPAFATVLFGDRVVALVYVGARPMAVVEFKAEANDPVCGRTLQDLVEQYQLWPLAMNNTALHRPLAEDVLARQVALGDQLLVLLELTSLERLLQVTSRV